MGRGPSGRRRGRRTDRGRPGRCRLRAGTLRSRPIRAHAVRREPGLPGSRARRGAGLLARARPATRTGLVLRGAPRPARAGRCRLARALRPGAGGDTDRPGRQPARAVALRRAAPAARRATAALGCGERGAPRNRRRRGGPGPRRSRARRRARAPRPRWGGASAGPRAPAGAAAALARGDRERAAERARRAAENAGALLGPRLARGDVEPVAASTPLRHSVPQPLRRRASRSPRGARAAILAYHRVHAGDSDPFALSVDPVRFAEQLDVLQREAVTLPLEEFADRAAAGDLPERAVALTFDDAYADVLEVAAPELERRG